MFNNRFIAHRLDRYDRLFQWYSVRMSRHSSMILFNRIFSSENRVYDGIAKNFGIKKHCCPIVFQPNPEIVESRKGQK